MEKHLLVLGGFKEIKYFAEDYWTMEKTEVFDTSLVNTYPVICKPKKVREVSQLY